MAATFGIDFGTTNSLVAIVGRDPETHKGRLYRMTQPDNRPHPSVVRYSPGEPVVGQLAKEQLDHLKIGVSGDIVRSPKKYLGSPTGIDVGGVTRPTVNVVADLLRFLKDDALTRGLGETSSNRLSSQFL